MARYEQATRPLPDPNKWVPDMDRTFRGSTQPVMPGLATMPARAGIQKCLPWSAFGVLSRISFVDPSNYQKLHLISQNNLKYKMPAQ